MEMRDIINLIEQKVVEASLPADWDLGGCWITDEGSIEEVDHASDLHHSHIALDNFGDDSMLNDEGEYDEYSRDMAQEIAYSEGWIRVSTRGSRSFSIEWRSQPTPAAKQTLLKLIRDDPNTYQSYEAESHEFSTFDNVRQFMQYLRKTLR